MTKGASAAKCRASALASVTATRAVLDRHGLATKKSLGQNFLVNDDVVRRSVELAEVSASDVVLEVGPGIGTLTVALLQKARSVVSIERDADLPPVLAETCAAWSDTFALIEKDALDVTAADIASACAGIGSPLPTMLVANLPYAVAATVVLGFFERFDWLARATIMVQKEVADRMAARPGSKDYGAYTVKLGLRAEPQGRFAVSPGNFYPPPHVDSAVIRLDRRVPLDEHCIAVGEDVIAAACMMADAAFASRRKTVANSCKTYFSGRGEQGARMAAALPQLLEAARIDPKRRGETLDQGEFIRLGRAFLEVRKRILCKM